MSPLVLGLTLGLPTSAFRVQAGPVVAEVESTLLVRHRVLAGVSWPLIARSWTLRGDATLSWLQQGGALARWGPGAEARLRFGRTTGRWQPYGLVVGGGHALPLKTVRLTASGSETSWTASPEWTVGFTVGLRVDLARAWGLDVGVDQRWVDLPGVALPGLHVGATWSGS